MVTLDHVVLEADEAAAAERFYRDAFGLDERLRVRAARAPSSGFRGFTLSLIVAQPAIVRHYLDAAVRAGATPIKEASKSLWGFGGVVQSPDGSVWKVASKAKKDSRDVPVRIEQIALLLGVADVRASKQFYVERGLSVGRSFGRRYVEFGGPAHAIKLALYGRRALAKDAGVDEEGTGSHRLAIASEAGPLTDPDGFVWEAA